MSPREIDGIDRYPIIIFAGPANVAEINVYPRRSTLWEGSRVFIILMNISVNAQACRYATKNALARLPRTTGYSPADYYF